MAEKRSLISLASFTEASRKFDYFMLWLSGALCAYVAQAMTPEKLGLNPYTFELIALAMLVTSVVFGFKRTESVVLAHLLNHRILHAYEVRGELMGKGTHGGAIMNQDTGDIYTPEQIATEIMTFEKEAQNLEPELEKLKAKVLSHYRWRNRFLALGFVGIVVARMSGPYLDAPAKANLPHQVPVGAGVNTNAVW